MEIREGGSVHESGIPEHTLVRLEGGRGPHLLGRRARKGVQFQCRDGIVRVIRIISHRENREKGTQRGDVT